MIRAPASLAPGIRVLVAGEEAALEAFLARHADSSMFLRASLHRCGLAPGATPQHGTYLAAVAGDVVTGVLAAYGSGTVVAQAPIHAAALAHALATHGMDASLSGLVGPAAQIAAIRPFLGPGARPVLKDSLEILLGLDLERLALPPALAQGRAAARRAGAADLDLLMRWRHDYMVETLGARAGGDLLARARADLEGDRLMTAWVLEVAGQPVACQSFNATLPDMVQVGGVWTPPSWRGRGYARAVVAGALRGVRGDGVRRSVLFTGSDNLPAQRAYRAIGFAPIGDYALVQYGEPYPARTWGG